MAGTMISNLFRTLASACRTLALVAACSALAMGTGCAWVQRVTHYQPSSARQPTPKEAKAQQRYYDRGLQQYTAENYGDAKKAFLRVVEYGPDTLLGLKAQDNLKKIERILKTVEEIESR